MHIMYNQMFNKLYSDVYFLLLVVIAQHMAQ